MSDTSSLIVAAHDGDREALESLFARHQWRLACWIREELVRGTSPELARRIAAEDLVQETLLEAARKLAEFEPRGSGSFYAWLVSIARFKVSEAKRSAATLKRSPQSLRTEPVDSSTGPSKLALRWERHEWLHKSIAELPEAQAEALRRRYLEGLSIDETARRLECSGAAVKALVSRGIETLSKRIPDES